MVLINRFTSSLSYSALAVFMLPFNVVGLQSSKNIKAMVTFEGVCICVCVCVGVGGGVGGGAG